MAEIFTMLIISVVANVMVILFANGWTEKKGSSLNRTAPYKTFVFFRHREKYWTISA